MKEESKATAQDVKQDVSKLAEMLADMPDMKRAMLCGVVKGLEMAAALQAKTA